MLTNKPPVGIRGDPHSRDRELLKSIHLDEVCIDLARSHIRESIGIIERIANLPSLLAMSNSKPSVPDRLPAENPSATLLDKFDGLLLIVNERCSQCDKGNNNKRKP